MCRTRDPHVVALVYQLEVRRIGEPSFRHDYSGAKRIERDEGEFRLVVERGQARFEFKEPFPTFEAARHSIKNYIADWELDAQLKFFLEEGPCSYRTFRLKLDHVQSEIVHSAPWRVNVGLAMRRSDSAYGLPTHPEPPAGNLVCKKAAQLYKRYLEYKDQGDKLLTVGNLAITLLEKGEPRGKKRKEAAKNFFIEENVLRKIADLANNRGGPEEARKADGVDRPLSDPERLFFEVAVLAIVRRMEEVRKKKPGEELKKITMSDLPDLS